MVIFNAVCFCQIKEHRLSDLALIDTRQTMFILHLKRCLLILGHFSKRYPLQVFTVSVAFHVFMVCLTEAGMCKLFFRSGVA